MKIWMVRDLCRSKTGLGANRNRPDGLSETQIRVSAHNVSIFFNYLSIKLSLEDAIHEAFLFGKGHERN